ncbi:IS630 transposase-related protein [Psychrobacter sp. LV10R520-6]|uniref:IS630 transposase-related protein n=1 Tax=Psychrobacter sp. LV10R520-6 TaxID=1415574 RepID=UPI0024C5F355|nr:IS630 transposase-related protein [Psychrobacter sp. LV10R520-6]SNT69898.1 Transposase [Psychrobacter sp. LV10R520-6]
MTYSTDFRAQVIKNIKQQDMSIRQACAFYNIGKTTLQRWLKNPSIKQTRDKPPSKIHDDLLLKDIEQYPDDCLYERAQRFNCSKTGIHTALKRLGISQKKDLGTPKSVSDKKSGVPEEA